MLYEFIFNNTIQVVLMTTDNAAGGNPEPIFLDPQACLGQVGFELADGLLPYPSQSFPGYRLLTEFFAFPSKFLFLDLKELGKACRAGFSKTT